MNSFEDFSVLGQLLTNIFWSYEDVDEYSPVLLYLEPFVDDDVDSA